MHMIRQAIATRWLPPTNFKPSRVTAWADAGRVTLSWEHGLNVDQNHARAAQALAEKFDWKGAWYQGSLPRASGGYAFVCVDGRFDDDISPAFQR